jgi:nitrogen fixation NifU-like protein
MAGTGLYDELVMDHIRNARNYRALRDPHRAATGSNPLCGDEMCIFLRMDGERIADIAFQCTCCGISMASASIMTELVRGTLAADAKDLLGDFVSMVESGAASSTQPMTPERLAMLDTVTKFPARAGCATLAWKTLADALGQDNAPHDPA